MSDDCIFGFDGSGLEPFNQGVFGEPRIKWPDLLPIPLRTGYSYRPTDRRTKTDMEIGGIFRVEFDTDETELQCSLRLWPDQAIIFESFEREILKQGSTWFELPVWVGGRIIPHLVRFSERPTMSQQPDVCTSLYTLTLQLSKRKLLCKSDVEGLMKYPPCEIRLYEKEFKVISALYVDFVDSLAGITILPTDLPPFFRD